MDEFYNDAFAKKVVSIISKMDDDEAEMFMRFSTHSVLMADIEANRRTVDNRVAEVHKRLQEGVAKAAASLVSKSASMDLREVAALVGTVSEVRKDKTPYEDLYGKPQPRGKGGKWTVSITREKTGKTPGGKKYERGQVMVGPEFNLTSALANTGQRTSQFQEAWNKDDPLHASTNKRTYDRIKAGSDALAYSSDPKMRAAGKVGGFFGQYGPEAEKVVGPHLRRTAYRYRGTERRPDTELIATANEASKAIMRNEGIDQGEFTPAMRTEASQRAATAYLNSRLPQKKWTKLQQASGKIPPSEGIIINADGKIITQAVGHADDHYLPFNLKNLKGLQGGHYVRSRSQGGLTTEDIYTGLVSGARSVTVVSRSGVFTVNFEDDFRGGRRYNDKAAGMVTRYAKTLDAVKSETVDRRPLSPEERAEIRDEVEREYGDMDMARADIEDLIKERETEYKTRPTLTKTELADIDLKAKKDNPGEREQRMARSELISAAMEKKAQRNYQLDGEGYEAAQEALREQFPYYIASVRAIHRGNANMDNSFTNERDKGYVKPRYIRPEGAKEGYHDKTINGRGKISADRLNYANWPNNPERRDSTAAREPEAPKENSPAAHIADKFKVAEAVAQGHAKRASNDALFNLTQAVSSGIKEDDLPPIVKEAAASREAFDKVSGNAVKRDQLVKELRDIHATIPEDKPLYAKMKPLFVALDATTAGEKWSGQYAERPSKPFSFDAEGGKKAAYGASASREQILKEWGSVVGKLAGEGNGITPGKFSDGQLADMASSFGYMGEALASGEQDKAAFAARASELGATPERIQQALGAMGTDRGKYLGEQLKKKSEQLHRLRALQANLERHPEDASTTSIPGTDVAPSTHQVDNTPADLTGAETRLRSFAATINDPDVASVYNSLSRSVRDLRTGVIDQSQFKRTVQDHFDELDDWDKEKHIKGHLRQMGLDVD